MTAALPFPGCQIVENHREDGAVRQQVIAISAASRICAAVAEDLPIGSGEIETAHRYIAQQRLKRPGAWWRVKHADYMLELRVTRRNGDWDAYRASIGTSGSPAHDADLNRLGVSRDSPA